MPTIATAIAFIRVRSQVHAPTEPRKAGRRPWRLASAPRRCRGDAGAAPRSRPRRARAESAPAPPGHAGNDVLRPVRQFLDAAMAVQHPAHVEHDGKRPAGAQVVPVMRGIAGQHQPASLGRDAHHLQACRVPADQVQADAGRDLGIAVVEHQLAGMQPLDGLGHVEPRRGCASPRGTCSDPCNTPFPFPADAGAPWETRRYCPRGRSACGSRRCPRRSRRRCRSA